MKSRKQMLQKMKLFHDQVRNKRISKCMWLQVYNEFQQVKNKDLDDGKDVEMFTFSIRGGKLFAAEQKNKRTKN